jgi:hypothetical protein
MSHAKQVVVGTAATGIVIAVSLGFISLFSFSAFTGWVSYLLLCLIPIQIIASVTWAGQQPRSVEPLKQPAKGMWLIFLCAIIGAIVAPLQFALAGGGIVRPTPMLMMCTIVSVVVTFWLAIMWGGWPFTKFIKNTLAAGLVMLVVAYLLNYALFRIFFDYDFMKGAPVYVPVLDPHGLFGAWHAMVFSLTLLTVMFLNLNFELWPFTNSRVLMQQPTLGVVWTGFVFAAGGLIFYVSVSRSKMDPVAFMITVPVPFIFGTIVVLNMLRGSLFGRLKQPLKGLLNAVAAALIGTSLAGAYRIVAPYVTGRLRPGPPSYDFETWLASALLAVTFPLMIFYAEFLKMWPLYRETEQNLNQAVHEA